MDLIRSGEAHPDLLRAGFEKVVKQFRESIALYTPDGSITFGELDQLSNTVGKQLMHSGCDECVIYLEVSLQYFVSVLACMKAGIPAIPFDPDQKNSQIREYVNDIENPVCLTNRELRTKALETFDIPIITFGEHTEYSTNQEVYFEDKNAGKLPLHRVLTSGSSGKQKMVTLNRESVHAHFEEASRIYGYRSGEVDANLGRHVSTSILNGFWRVILSGSSFVCFDLKRESFSEIYERLKKIKANGLHGPSSIMGKFIESCRQMEILEDVNRLIFGGEPLSSRIVKMASDLFASGCTVILNYSSTETMLISAFKTTLAEAVKMRQIPVGTTVPSKTVRLLDKSGREVKYGEPGEVVVTSKFIATEIREYDSEKRLKQVADRPDYRTYYTRDLARWNRNGQLEHLGRMDHQFKINGVRIDIKAIESALNNIEGIKNSAVIPHEMSNGQKQLFACVVREDTYILDSEIYRKLSMELQTSHLPAHIVNIEKMPVRLSGKKGMSKLQDLCREHLEKMKNRHRQATSVERSDVESFLKEAWSEVLKKAIHEDSTSFFAEGGDSLAVSELVSQINEKYHIDLEPVWVFKYPLLDQQLEYLSNLISDKDRTKSVVANSGKQETSIDEIKDLLGW